MGLLLANQKVELTAAIERQKIIRAHHLNHDIFKDLHYRVSFLALEKINEQLKNLEELSPITDQCTQQFTRTWGLPCKHSIRNFVRTGRRLKIIDIHSQWHLDESIAPASFVEQPMTPRKRLLARLTTELYSANARVGSLIARLTEVIETPEISVQEPAVVIKKRGRPAGAKNKNSLTRDKSQFEYVLGKNARLVVTQDTILGLVQINNVKI